MVVQLLVKKSMINIDIYLTRNKWHGCLSLCVIYGNEIGNNESCKVFLYITKRYFFF